MRRNAADWLEELKDLGVTRPLRIMNVCGGHERSIIPVGGLLARRRVLYHAVVNMRGILE